MRLSVSRDVYKRQGPGVRTEDLLLVQVVHRDRDSQHGGQGNQVLADVAVHKRAVALL